MTNVFTQKLKNASTAFLKELRLEDNQVQSHNSEVKDSHVEKPLSNSKSSIKISGQNADKSYILSFATRADGSSAAWDPKDISSNLLISGNDESGSFLIFRDLAINASEKPANWKVYGIDFSGIEFTKLSSTYGFTSVSDLENLNSLLHKLELEVASRDLLLKSKSVDNMTELEITDKPKSILVLIEDMSQIAKKFAKEDFEEIIFKLESLMSKSKNVGVHFVMGVKPGNRDYDFLMKLNSHFVSYVIAGKVDSKITDNLHGNCNNSMSHEVARARNYVPGQAIYTHYENNAETIQLS